MDGTVMTIKVDRSLHERITETAKQDYRKQVDQIRYLLNLGLSARAELRAINEGRTQVDMDALKVR